MKVGLYNSCFENSAVADVSLAVLASALSQSHESEIITHPNSTTTQDLSLVSGYSLQHVPVRVADAPPQTITDPNQPDRRYQTLRDWSNELTRPYDLFINFADRLPLYCAAPRGVLMVQFPHDFVPLLYRNFWQSHLANYQLKLVNSYYTRFWTNVFWDFDCSVVYPPLPTLKSTFRKDNLIVSMGPFDVLDARRQLRMLSLFNDLRPHLSGWSLVIIGTVDSRIAKRKLFHEFRRAADNAGVRVVTNPTSAELLAVLERARILWQVPAVDHPGEREPHKSEPFCLRVLQAMSAGCVPLVTNSGGFAEAIRHGDTGFFWKNLAELGRYTMLVANDHSKRSRIAQAAGKRAKDFHAERYLQSFMSQLENAFEIRAEYKARSTAWWRRLLGSQGKSGNREAVP